LAVTVSPQDIFTVVAAPVVAVLLIVVVRARRRSHAQYLEEVAGAEVCDHLRPAYDLLRSRGHRVIRVGQNGPDLPLEVHLAPTFDPKQVYAEAKLAEPAFLSERNVLYCKEDWCELHPPA
jgi:hypothetical protein